MFSQSHPSMTSAPLRRRLRVQSQRETAEWQELDVRELSTDAQLAVSTGLIHVLAALPPRSAPSPRRAVTRRRASASPPYQLFDLPVAPQDDPVSWD
jgi:hypothetical protein